MANTVNVRGEFQLNTDYHVLDIVSNGDRSYVCVRANDGEDVTDQEYWMLLARGPQGPQGDPGETNETATNALDLANSVNSKVTEIQSNGGGVNLAIGTTGQKCEGPRQTADGGQVSLDTWKSLRGQWVTISCDISWTGFTKNAEDSNRIGYEVGLHYSDGTQQYISNWYSPTDSEVNKNFRFGGSWKLEDKELTSIDEGSLFNQIDATTCVTSKLMIEKGTVAHDWSPAPEDIQSEIDALEAAVKKLGGTI